MTPSTGFITAAEAARLLAHSAHPLLMGHVEIDGDALGSAVALLRAFRARGAAPRLVLHEPAPRIFDFLLEAGDAEVVTTAAGAAAAMAERDLVVVLDNNAWSRLGCMAPSLGATQVPVLCIDHHPCSVPFSDRHCLDTGAAATGVLVQEILEALTWPIDAPAADALYTAIVNDTGWFRWSNTDRRVLEAAARLVSHGARPDRVAAFIMLRESLAAKKLLACFLDTVTVTQDGRLATGFVSRDMFASTGALREDSEDFVNHLRALEGVALATFLREDADGIKLSFRTRAPLSARKLALLFEGGGHEQAAGGRHQGPLLQALRDVQEAACRHLDSSAQPA